MLIWMYLFMLRVVSAFSIIADVTDEHELDHGLRQEGTFYSAMAFTTKLAAAVGPLFGGLALDVIGLQEGMSPGQIPAGTLDGLAIAMTVGVVPLLGLAWYFTFRISMSEEHLANIQSQLSERAANR